MAGRGRAFGRVLRRALRRGGPRRFAVAGVLPRHQRGSRAHRQLLARDYLPHRPNLCATVDSLRRRGRVLRVGRWRWLGDWGWQWGRWWRLRRCRKPARCRRLARCWRLARCGRLRRGGHGRRRHRIRAVLSGRPADHVRLPTHGVSSGSAHCVRQCSLRGRDQPRRLPLTSGAAKTDGFSVPAGMKNSLKLSPMILNADLGQPTRMSWPVHTTEGRLAPLAGPAPPLAGPFHRLPGAAGGLVAAAAL